MNRSLQRGDHVVLPSGRRSTIKGIRRNARGVLEYLCGTPSWRGSYRPHGVFTARDLRRLVTP